MVPSRKTSPQSRRASTKAQTSGEENKKLRGRPKVVTNDETAAGRRRTQVRVAQRAYRLRKETTITRLEQRTWHLRDVINRMNSAIQRFNCHAQEAGLGVSNVELSQQLQETAQTIAQMAEDARARSDESVGQEKVTNVDTDKHVNYCSEDNNARSSRFSSFESVLVEASTSETSTGALAERGFSGVPIHDITHESTEQWEWTLTSSEISPSYHGRQNSLVDMLIRSPLPSPSVVDAVSYSFLETSFARRLHRRALETAYNDSLVRPERFNRIFKIPLLYLGRDAVRERLKFRLVKGLDEPIDGVLSALRYLGGAGTHYPEREEYTRVLEGPRGFVCSMEGLQDVADGREQSMSPKAQFDVKGYEGEWFDPNDVEGYLEEMGIHIDPQSMFAQGEMIVDTLPSGCNGSASSAWITGSPDPYTTDMDDAPSQPPLSTFDNISYSGDQDSVPQDLCWDIDRTLGANSSFEDSQTGFNSSTFANHTSTVQLQKRMRKRVTIDVARLVDELVKRAVCLGFSPGFRRHDVDIACHTAIAAF